jgi:hypothetical protein
MLDAELGRWVGSWVDSWIGSWVRCWVDGWISSWIGSWVDVGSKSRMRKRITGECIEYVYGCICGCMKSRD